MVAIGRWFMAALVVSGLSLSGIILWNSGLPSGLEILWLPLVVVPYASMYIFPAALLAALLGFLVSRFMQPWERYRGLMAIGLGSLSGLVVMSLAARGFEPAAFLVIATAAGGTGGAMSETDFPLLSRRGLLTLAVGLVVSVVLLIAVGQPGLFARIVQFHHRGIAPRVMKLDDSPVGATV
ncbi:MAG: hypothetical protein JWN15_2949 [Firmicutes bacterium]|nr:hypothetical protein [Bacillota bacterium]